MKFPQLTRAVRAFGAFTNLLEIDLYNIRIHKNKLLFGMEYLIYDQLFLKKT
jgi:hypothetical protein